MNQETAKLLLPLLFAISNGEPLEYRNLSGCWREADPDEWASSDFIRGAEQGRWRVKLTK